ncbi:MAG: hypothetical protein M3Z33_00690 [Actinomycetota bacterium]|nr:hypothetical protein [Actinomycetota bacterium]
MLLTDNFLQIAAVRPVGGVFLPIGLLLVAIALGAALHLNLRDKSRKVRGAVGVLGLLLVLLGGWSLLSKPKVVVTGLSSYPLQQVLRGGEPCPASIDVLAVVRATGGPGPVALELSFDKGRKTVPVITPEFAQSPDGSRQAFGPYPVQLPRNPPRSAVPLLLHVTSPNDVQISSVVRNAGCVPRR